MVYPSIIRWISSETWQKTGIKLDYTFYSLESKILKDREREREIHHRKLLPFVFVDNFSLLTLQVLSFEMFVFSCDFRQSSLANQYLFIWKIK